MTIIEENDNVLKNEIHTLICENQELKQKIANLNIISKSPLKATKLSLEKEYQSINSGLKDKLYVLEMENEGLKRDLSTINSKYESLRDTDSPIKEVSQTKKLLKQTESENQAFKQENRELKLKSNKLEESVNSLSEENQKLCRNLLEITEKYESLRDIDSPVKEISQIRKITKQNDVKIESLKEENSLLSEKVALLEPFRIENEELKKQFKEVREKYESLRDIDSPVKEVSQIRKIMRQNDEKLQSLHQENLALKNEINKFEEQNGEFLRKLDGIQAENRNLNDVLIETQKKYENLRDLESPVQEVSQMKKILKENDKKKSYR